VVYFKLYSMVIKLGKLVSVYLRTEEEKEIDSLCEENPNLNTHKTIKMALDRFLASRRRRKP